VYAATRGQTKRESRFGNIDPDQDKRKNSCTKKIPSEMDINLAHDSWGHQSEGLLKKTAKIYGIKLTDTLKACEGCCLAKAKQKAVSKTTTTVADKPGIRIFVDQSGPFSDTWDGKQYHRQAVDDYSSFGWCRIGKAKSGLADWFRDQVISPLKALGCNVRSVRMDGAGENVSGMEALCEREGIAIEYTSPYYFMMMFKIWKRSDDAGQ